MEVCGITNTNIKSKLIQIWKSPHIFKFIHKQYPKNLAFLIVIILELFTRKVWRKLIFNILNCFCMFVNKHFANFTRKQLEKP